MDIKALDKNLTSLIEKKIALSKIDYNNEDYDKIEEDLHALEDEFLESYGSYLEDAFSDVHDEYCPDIDVLLPIAYLPNEVIVTDNGYDIPFKEGVYVEMDDYPGKETRLVLLSQPTRIVLQIDPLQKEVVWTAK